MTPPPVPARRVYKTPVVDAPAYEVSTTPSAPPVTGAAVKSAPVPASPAANDLKSLLGSSSNIRAAILLREILGTPKGLQSGDVIPGLR